MTTEITPKTTMDSTTDRQTPLAIDGSSPDFSLNGQTFGTSIWPLFWLNAGAFGCIALVSLFFFNTLETQGLAHREVTWIVGYFLGIGGLIALAGGVFGWLGGPEVTLSSQGILVRTTWLMDRTFPELRTFEIAWSEITAVSRKQFVTMPYFKLDRPEGPSFYLPLFVRRKKQFRQCLLQWGGHTPLRPFIDNRF